MINAKSENVFYYDPHKKHYTGQLKTLATWCPSVRLADMHIITWEKVYERDKWDADLKILKGYIVKTKNHRNDEQLVHYQYQKRLWDKNPDMRQIIGQVLDKK